MTSSNTQNRISYTQVSMYNQCPYKWKLNYVDGLRQFGGNIHTIFGSAMHEVLQKYLEIMYSVTAKKANEYDYETMLHEQMIEHFKAITNEEDLPTKEEMVEFYNHGLLIIDYFKKHRGEYFSKRGYSLVGCEVPIEVDLKNNIQMVGYLDIVMLDELTNTIKIYDIKTSTMGWNKWMKKDTNKTDQLLYYKQFYSKQYNHPIDKIDVEYFIVKRKLWENAMFPQKRIQKFSPANGKPSLNKAGAKLVKFIDEAFTDEGEYNTEQTFEKLPSDKNCKWCEFKNSPELCDRKK